MKRTIIIPFFVISLVFSTANAYAILNGTLDTTNRAVGMLIDIDNNYSVSGVLIAPNWVLTIAGFAEICEEGHFITGNSIEDYDEAIPFTEVFIHPEYNSDGYYNNIALIKLSKPLFAMKPMPLLEDQALVGVGTTLEVVGYGLLDIPDGYTDSRHHCFTHVSSLTDTLIMCDYGSPPTGASPGDSGGPALVDSGGIKYIAGITAGSSGEDSNDTFWMTRFPAYRSFVDETIAAAASLDAAPSTPILVSPSQGATVPASSLALSWEKSVDPEGKAVTYQLLLSDDADFGNPETTDVPASAAPAILVGSPLAFVCIRRKNKKTRSLAILILALIIAFAISCVQGASIETSPTPNPSPSADPGSPTVPTATPTIVFEKTGLLAGTTYYWKIAAIDSSGNYSLSEARSFTTE